MCVWWLLCVAAVQAAWKPGLSSRWKEAPQSIAEFEFNKTANAFVVDPWYIAISSTLLFCLKWSKYYFRSYVGRLGAYKTLLASTKQLQYSDEFGNPLWGLPLQFAWQHDTGRLFSGVNDTINVTSWWAGMVCSYPHAYILKDSRIHIDARC